MVRPCRRKNCGRNITKQKISVLMVINTQQPVRELAHVIERGALLHGGPTLQAEHLSLAVAKAKALLVVKPGAPVQVDFSKGGIVLEDVERHLITEALQASGWNRLRAAQLLGISKETLRYRIEKHQLQTAA